MQIGSRRKNELDVLTDQPPQHIQKLTNHDVQVQDCLLQNLLPAESQKLRRQVRGTLGGYQDALGAAAQWIFLTQLVNDQFAATADDVQNVVKVVRNSAC